MKNGIGHHKKDDFIAPARRAFRRVARQIRSEHAKLGMPLVFGENGKVRFVRAR
jgi:hypothetical protein